jgi:hypothetical protein
LSLATFPNQSISIPNVPSYRLSFEAERIPETVSPEATRKRGPPVLV